MQVSRKSVLAVALVLASLAMYLSVFAKFSN